MFIKKSYQKEFERVCKKQYESVFKLDALMNSVSDEWLFQRLKKICEIQSHAYSQTKESFELLSEKNMEKRRELRENLLGTVKFKEHFLGSVGEGKCLDISSSGAQIYLQNNEDLSSGQKVFLWIRLLGENVSSKRVGIVRWVREVQYGAYLCGVEYTV